MIKGKEKEERREGRYRGIRVRKWGKWVSEIRLPRTKRRLWLGSYETAEEAARAFDVGSYCIHGPRASLNFPNSPPLLNIPRGIRLSPQQIKAAAIEAASAKSLPCGADDDKKDESFASVDSEFEPPEHHQMMSKCFESLLWDSPNDQVSSTIYISAYLGVALTMDCVIPYDHGKEMNCYTYDFSEHLDGLWSS
ncbi:hypothetical protein SUGI_0044970 [Cryptomeria japonica]|uniref:ethylene-responsive transcription factor ERF017 n=1 Tax=Cryptomeria japonica TaxID=3369 RepID=UPI002408AB87|nr:ethylene-responsive transcription factor ERF017 [Cryptomeria japonica]GLJ06680.1 hypothetical protein SUGI_0044970 [Cryptomeria japonica]